MEQVYFIRNTEATGILADIYRIQNYIDKLEK